MQSQTNIMMQTTQQVEAALHINITQSNERQQKYRNMLLDSITAPL